MDDPTKFQIAQDPYVAHNTLTYVLPYLKILDLLQLMQVCKLWNKIILESGVWNRVILQNYKFDFNTMLNSFAHKKTTHLIVMDCVYKQNDSDNLPSDNLSEVPSIKELEISEFKTFINFKKKEERKNLDLKFLEKLKNIETLILNTKKPLSSADSICHLKMLKHLVIKSFGIVRKLTLENKFDLKSLETLELSNIDNADLDKVLLNLKALKNLRIGNTRNVFNNSEIYWEKLQVIKEMPSLKRLELVNFLIKYRDLATCPNLEVLFIVPHSSLDICSNVSDLKNSNITQFILGISEEHFKRLISEIIFAFQRDISFHPPWQDIPFQPEMVNRLLSLNFGNNQYPGLSALASSIIEGKYNTFLTTLQQILSHILPNIKVSVIEFDDKWSDHECMQWSGKYT